MGSKLLANPGYVNLYQEYSQLSITPELDAYSRKVKGSKVDKSLLTSLAYDTFSYQGVYSQKVFYDQILPQKSSRKNTA